MTKMELYGWQNADLEKILEAGGSGLINSEPGAGKTLEAVELIRRLDPRVTLIVAPLSTIETAWKKTCLSQLNVDIRRIGASNKREKVAFEDLKWGVPGVYITTPQWITRKDVSDLEVDFCIVDEIHMMSNPGSKGQKRLEQLTAASTYRLAMSGTPVRSQVSRAWSLNRFLWPDRNGGGDIADSKYWRWAMQRLESQEIYTNQRDQWGNPKKVKQFLGERETGRIFREMPCVVQHFAREKCCNDPEHENGFLRLDEPTVLEHQVPMTPVQRRAIRDMETTMVAYLDDNPMVADIPLTAMQRIRQCVLAEPTVTWTKDDNDEDVQTVTFEPDAKSPLYDVVKENLEELGDEPVVLFSDSAKYVRYVAERLNREGIATGEYSGSRKSDLTKFGTEYRVLVAVISSVSTGTDGLQEKASTEMWLSRSLDEVDNRQGESRLDRRGNTRQVRRYLYFDDLGISEGRMSEQISKRLEVNRSARIAV